MVEGKNDPGRRDRRWAANAAGAVCFLVLGGLASPTVRSGTPVTLTETHAGFLNFTGTGGTLRTQPNGADACAVTTSSSANLSGLPAGATVRSAVLYWAGSYSTQSGSTQTAPDFNVTLNGVPLAADRTFTETFSSAGTDYDFYSGVTEVTGQVAGTGNGTYTFGNLGVNTGPPHCAVQAVLGGWSLVVIYDDPAQPLRVINLFEGFQYYRGGSISLTPANFEIPVSPIDGRHAHVSWEGDSTNSGSLNGFSETLSFEGAGLTDALNPPNNQFNSTITVTTPPDNAAYGVDFDVYAIDPYLFAGQTSATTIYSSGQDLVLLSAEVVSVTNVPVADLSLQKAHVADFVVGQNETYFLTVTNAGPSVENGPVVISDTLPAGLTFVTEAGAGWSCAPTGQQIDCTHPGPIAVGAALPDLLLTVAVDAAALPSVQNSAVVTGSDFDIRLTDNGAVDDTTVIVPDLSTSTKTVLDINGGDAEPGDTLRYTVTLTESANAAAAGAQVADDIPANVSGFAVVSIPPGASDVSLPAGGANATGFLDIRNIDVAAGGAASVVFDVVVSGAAMPGTVIANIATVTNPNGPGAVAAAPDVIVSQSSAPAAGNKPLYLYTSPGRDLSRTPPSAAQPNRRITRNQTSTWTMTPQSQGPLTFDGNSGPIPVTLWLRKGGGSGSTVTRTVMVTLFSTGATSGPIGAPVTLTLGLTGTPQEFTFDVPMSGDVSLATGSTVALSVTNSTSGGGGKALRVFPVGTTSNSRVDLPSQTVINVDSVVFYDAAYPGGAPVGTASGGDTVFLRAVVSDPFGSFDIAGAALDLGDPNAVPVLTAAAMTQVNDSGAATRTFELAYTIPAVGPSGAWTARVTADEGTEGAVRHTGIGVLTVGGSPTLTIMKSASTATAAPGTEIVYTIQIINTSAATATTVVVEDALGKYTAFALDAFGPGLGFDLQQGAPPSGLSLGAPQYSDDNGATFAYTPVSGGGGAPAGYDGKVTHWRIPMQGAMNASSASFTIRFKTVVN